MRLHTAALLLCAGFGAAIPASTRWGAPVSDLLGTVRLPRRLADAIPLEFRGWTGTDQPLRPEERRILDLDDSVQRSYQGPGGETVTLFIAFYGNKQKGLQRYYHNPTICYRDAGWDLTDTRFESRTIQDAGEELPTCRYLFEQGGRRLSVTTFFRIDDQFLDESPRNKPFWTLIEKLTPDVSDAPGSFVQVQIVVPVPEPGEEAAAGATSRFLQTFGPAILRAIDAGSGS